MEPKESKLGASILVPSVQELVKDQHLNKTIPSRYVRDDQEPPQLITPSSQSPEVPIIDMQHLTSEDELQKLHLACKHWGFFQIINHGVDSTLLERVKKETQDFFKLPFQDKQKFWQTTDDIEGLGQAFVVSEDQKLDWADMFYMVTLPHHIRKPRLFPNLPLPFRYFTSLRMGQVVRVT